MAFGSGAMTNSIAEIGDADCIFVIGSNTTENHPVIALDVKKAAREKGAKVIVADPRRIELVDYAVLHLQQKPGTDVALLNGMIQAIISNGWLNKAFIDERTEGFDALAESVSEYTPEAVEKITGIPAADIVEATRSSTVLVRSSPSTNAVIGLPPSVSASAAFSAYGTATSRTRGCSASPSSEAEGAGEAFASAHL